MSNLFNKTINSVRNNGIKFTLSMLKFRLFGGDDPRTQPEYIEHYAKRTEQGRFTEFLIPYCPDAKELPVETVFEIYRTLLPIDCIIEPQTPQKRLNLVLEYMDENHLSDTWVGPTALATAFAHTAGVELRIIARNSPADARAYYRTMASLGILLPEKVTFYTDLERDNRGNCQFKLPVSQNDLFMATSWQTAVAVGKTVLYPNYMYYFAANDFNYTTPGAESYLHLIPDGAQCILETAEQFNLLTTYYPQLAQSAICLELFGKADTLTFMENRTQWKKS